MQVATVEEYVQNDTAYLRKHMLDALKLLEKAGDLAVADTKADGKKRRAGTYPNDALVRFSAIA